MGKGYNNYMCKKPFHPGSKANIKRTWMAEQRTENEKKKQDELKVQYEKEQELYNNRALISTESKDKLELNFMYEAPPGAKRERQKEDDEPEYKFEWQRKYNAPREDFAKGNTEIRDQPFGIPVRNVRCIKCHKWGHINTDKECPLFSQASTSAMPATSMDPLELMRQMREDGFNLKQSVLGHRLNPQAANQQLLESEEEDPEKEFLQSLTSKQKQKLLKKLNKELAKQKKKDSSCTKKKKSKKKHKNKRKASESESEDEKEIKRAKKKGRKSNDQRPADVDSNESSDSADNKEEIKHKKSKKTTKCRDQRSMDIGSRKNPDSAPNMEDVRKQKKSVDQQHEAHNSSEESDSEGDKQSKKRDKKNSSTSDSECGEQNKKIDKKNSPTSTPDSEGDKQSKKRDKKKSQTSASDESFTSAKASEVKQKHLPSKSVKLEGDATETMTKRRSKGPSSQDNSDENFSNVEHQIGAKQEAKDSSSNHGRKRKELDSSSDAESSSCSSGSSSRESNPKDYMPKKLKSEKESSDTAKVEPSGSQAPSIIGICTEKSSGPEHPDRFTCSTPPENETGEKSNLATFLLERRYHGDKDEKFRRINRDRRSPSFKQKYRLP